MLNIILIPHEDANAQKLLIRKLRYALQNEGMKGTFHVVDEQEKLGGVLDALMNEKDVMILSDLHLTEWLDFEKQHLSRLAQTPVVVYSESMYAHAFLDKWLNNLNANDLVVIDAADLENLDELQKLFRAFKIAERNKAGFITSEAHRVALKACGSAAEFFIPKTGTQPVRGNKGPQHKPG